MPPTAPVTKVVTASDPTHPSHSKWWSIMQGVLVALKMAESIGPAVVTVVDPGDAKLAQQLGTIATAATPDPSALGN